MFYTAPATTGGLLPNDRTLLPHIMAPRRKCAPQPSNIYRPYDLATCLFLVPKVTSLSEALRDSRAAIVTLQRREAAALSELARYDANNARRVEQVQALLAAAGGNHPGGGNALKENGMAAEVGPGGGARVREGGGAAGALAELVALGEAIADRAREIADLKVRVGCSLSTALSPFRQRRAHVEQRTKFAGVS